MTTFIDVPTLLRVEHQKLWGELSEHVATICAGRDESHGHAHMQKVALNSLEILEGEVTSTEDYSEVGRLVLIVAWLHDVADHKYDHDGTLQAKLDLVIEKVARSTEEAAMIAEIILRISFSKEKRLRDQLSGPIDWLSLLKCPRAVLVRHIVSDADKLEAIGSIGILRCKEYSAAAYAEAHQGQTIPVELLHQQVIEHADEKLLRLTPEYIVTPTGKKLAQPLHQQMINELASL